MHHLCFLPNFTTLHDLRLPWLFLLVLASPLAVSRSHSANEINPPPPAYPDTAHVSNGCYISAVAYVAKFLAEFPGERATPLTVDMKNADGRKRPHTIAILTWKGLWWARDEYHGVFDLNRAVRRMDDASSIRSTAAHMLELQATGFPATVSRGHANSARRVSSAQWANEITLAASLLPFATEQFCIRSDKQEIMLLFFRPAKGVIAVYDPRHGTASASCAMNDGAAIVAQVAARLGYNPDTIVRYPITTTAARSVAMR